MPEKENKTMEFVMLPDTFHDGRIIHTLRPLTEDGLGEERCYSASKNLKKLSVGCVYEIETDEDGSSIYAGTATFRRRYYPESAMGALRREHHMASQQLAQYKAAKGQGKLGKTLEGIEPHVQALRQAYMNTTPAQRTILLAAIIGAISKY